MDMKAAIYCRVSSADQSCTIQLEELRRYAAARGLEIYQEYVDEAVSGTEASRPALDRLMADARARRFDMVLVVRVDRWARSVTDCMASLKILDGYGIAWVATLQNLTTEKSDPMGKLMLTMLAAFAQLERDMTRERSLAGIARAKKEGTKSGRAFGRPKRVFQRDEVATMRDAGKSWAQIGIALGIPAGTAREALRKVPPGIVSSGTLIPQVSAVAN